MEPTSIGLLNELSKALKQQLFFWGCDVVHSRGNLLSAFGLERCKYPNIKGSSCYRTIYKDDIIELHSLCVGRYSEHRPSFFYTREYRLCCVYEDSKPPLPGHYDETLINKKSFDKIQKASRSFTEWWVEYEHWIETVTEPEYRIQCHRSYLKLPNSKKWLKPCEALSWLQQFIDSPELVIGEKIK